MLRNLFLVFIGGGTGSMLRYLSSLLAARWAVASVFPLATFLVNILGCFVAGVLVSSFDRGLTGTDWRLLLITGFCGGYTTFSAFSTESFAMMQRGEWLVAVLYIAASILIGLAVVGLGVLAGKA
jgi:CrcB protein